MTTIRTVLIAEDGDFLRETLQLALEEKGMTVIAVENGEKAIEEMNRSQPDLALCDLMMPRKDGYEVLQHRKEQGYEFPMIMLTNVSDDENKDRALDLGAIGFLVKSDMDEEALWDEIQQCIAEATASE